LQRRSAAFVRRGAIAVNLEGTRGRVPSGSTSAMTGSARVTDSEIVVRAGIVSRVEGEGVLRGRTGAHARGFDIQFCASRAAQKNAALVITRLADSGIRCKNHHIGEVGAIVTTIAAGTGTAIGPADRASTPEIDINRVGTG